MGSRYGAYWPEAGGGQKLPCSDLVTELGQTRQDQVVGLEQSSWGHEAGLWCSG